MESEHSHARRPTWIVAAGLCLLPVYLWVLNGLVADLFWGAFVGGILVIGLVTISRLPQHRAAWVWILGGQVCFLFGDLGFNYFAYISKAVRRTRWPTASTWPATRAWRSGWCCCCVQGPMDLGGLVDGLIVAVGTGVFLWVFLMAPTASDTTLTVADRLIGCAYPAGDLLLITIGAQVAVRQLRRGIPFWTLTASLLFMLIADVGYVPIAPQHVLRRRAARRRVVDQLRADRRRRGTPRRVQSGRTASGDGHRA